MKFSIPMMVIHYDEICRKCLHEDKEYFEKPCNHCMAIVNKATGFKEKSKPASSKGAK